MPDSKQRPVEDLMLPQGFDPYFSDIVAVRDLIDPPIRNRRRRNKELSLVPSPDDYGSKYFVDTDERMVVLYGLHGISDISNCFEEGLGSEASEAERDRLIIDGIRFAIMYQSGEAFINHRLTTDENFLARFVEATPADKTGGDPDLREEMKFPDVIRNVYADGTTQSRVGAFSARIAFNRLINTPSSDTLQEAASEGNGGALILDMFRERLDDEVESACQVGTGDCYPKMWYALSHPIKGGLVPALAMPHIGFRSSPSPGWISLK